MPLDLIPEYVKAFAAVVSAIARVITARNRPSRRR